MTILFFKKHVFSFSCAGSSLLLRLFLAVCGLLTSVASPVVEDRL